MAQPNAGASTWKPPLWPEILRRPLPYPGIGDRWLMRLMALIARRQIISISGLDHVRSDRDPFIIAANHSTRREAVLFPTMLIFLRGGRLIHFLSDWNNSLLPGIGLVMQRAGVVTVVRKPAKPKFLNLLKPLFRHAKPAHERAIDLLRAGRSVGAFPEGTVNRDPKRMLPGRTGTAWLSLRSGAPVVPVGIRYPFIKDGEQITERSPMEIHIGRPMYPGGVSAAPTLTQVHEWHEKIMREISALSGKSWSPARAKAALSVGRAVSASRVQTVGERDEAIAILKATYEREKSWVRDAEGQFPISDLTAENITWFVARIKGQPAGVLRVLYDPPLGLYAKYGFKMIDPTLDIEAFVKNNRVAEVGRFAVLPESRNSMFVAAALMRGATAEAVARGYSHLVTDVFEDDPHSPYGFHTRVIGFQPVATHDVGELNTTSRRITLLLDLAAAYKKLRASQNWFYRYMTEAWDAATHKRLAA